MAALAAVVFSSYACDTENPTVPVHATAAVPAYTVRGVVKQATDDTLFVHHEAIDDFADLDGQVIGMDAMVMRFHLAPGLVHGYQEGDKLEFLYFMGGGRWS